MAGSRLNKDYMPALTIADDDGIHRDVAKALTRIRYRIDDGRRVTPFAGSIEVAGYSLVYPGSTLFDTMDGRERAFVFSPVGQVPGSPKIEGILLADEFSFDPQMEFSATLFIKHGFVKGHW